MLELQRLLPLALALAAATPLTHATVLTFDSTFGTGGIAAYGDRVSAASQGGATYGATSGWTPDVTLDFITGPGFAPPSLWAAGYGGNSSLNWALGHAAYNVPFELVLTPDAGHEVRLESFSYATWSSGTYQTAIRVWDDLGTFDAPNLLFMNLLLPPHQSFGSPSLAGKATQGAVHFHLSNLGSVGIDNLVFSQAGRTVPEPHALALAALGLVGLAGSSRRWRRAA